VVLAGVLFRGELFPASLHLLLPGCLGRRRAALVRAHRERRKVPLDVLDPREVMVGVTRVMRV